MKRSTLLAIVMFLTTNTGLAYTNSYVSVGGGYVVPVYDSNFTTDSPITGFAPLGSAPGLFKLTNVNWKSQYDNGFEANFAVGATFFPCWRGEFEFVYQNMARRIGGTYDLVQISTLGNDVFAPSLNNLISNAAIPTNIYSFLLNAYFDFINDTKWTPSLGVGLGVAWINASGNNSKHFLVMDDLTRSLAFRVPTFEKRPALSGATIAWQIKAAIAYKCDAHIAIIGQYRLLGTTNFNGGVSGIIIAPNAPSQTIFSLHDKGIGGILNNAFDLIFRYSF